MAVDVSAPLPELDWPDQAIITVDSGDASATVVKLTIHLSQDAPEELLNFPEVPVVLAYVPDEGAEAPAVSP